MPLSVLIGAQWGDEGKGKIVDLLARRVDWVARFSGGPNAGHTVRIDGETFVLHLLPSGILRPGVCCLIGHGVVLDLDHLEREIQSLEERGVRIDDRLKISSAAHLLLPYHRWLEELQHQDVRVGTTKRGIGPAYQDKMGRVGLRVHDLLDERHLKDRLEEELSRVEAMHRGWGRPMPEIPRQASLEWARRYAGIARRLGPAIVDTVALLHGELDAGKSVLCEGSQGTFLDIDLGTYPFVTSASTTIGGAIAGLGLPPSRISRVNGVAKAYTTRVGNGPFPTEFGERIAGSFRKKAGEFGATTGRPRRCGWFDAVLVRHAVRVNGIGEICLTKLDVLTGMRTLKLAVGYRVGRRTLEHPPVDPAEWAACKPVYEDLPGWTKEIGGARAPEDLPAEARRYVEKIEALCGAPVRLVSVGSAREAAVRMPARRRPAARRGRRS
ncbi:MAG: adenylosuccinate synthase [Candidatus Eisenbacteria bacterium]|nr:adenylosuccinate synthase [Candidatus Eisenbacteria bacterium]